PRQTRGSSASAATTISIRHHTSGSAGRVMSFPRIAVKPHSSTHRWICQRARVVSDLGMRALLPARSRAMSHDYIDYLHDLFSAFAPVTTRRMFGGHGVYRDGVIL